MSVIIPGRSFSTNKATEENTTSSKKMSKSSVSKKFSVQENPSLKRVDTSSHATPVNPRQRRALGDVSNTSHKAQPMKNKQHVDGSVKKSSGLELKTPVSLKTDDNLPDIEYMPIHVDKDESQFQPPSYLKGIVLSAMKTNPFKYTREVPSIKEQSRLLIESVNRPDTSCYSDLPGLFYQLDMGAADIDLPDINELNL